MKSHGCKIIYLLFDRERSYLRINFHLAEIEKPRRKRIRVRVRGRACKAHAKYTHARIDARKNCTKEARGVILRQGAIIENRRWHWRRLVLEVREMRKFFSFTKSLTTIAIIFSLITLACERFIVLIFVTRNNFKIYNF